MKTIAYSTLEFSYTDDEKKFYLKDYEAPTIVTDNYVEKILIQKEGILLYNTHYEAKYSKQYVGPFLRWKNHTLNEVAEFLSMTPEALAEVIEANHPGSVQKFKKSTSITISQQDNE